MHSKLAAVLSILIAWSAVPHLTHAEESRRLPKPTNDPQCVADREGKVFVTNKVRALPSMNFNFRGNGGGDNPKYTGPDFSQSLTDAQMIADLQHAFKLAPPWLQSAVCNSINYVFIDPDAQQPYGWGFFEAPTQADGLGRFIGLSASLWNAPPLDSLTVASIQTDIVHSLLGTSATQLPVYSASPDGVEWALLSIIAHEMGHIEFFEKCWEPGYPGACGDFLLGTGRGWKKIGNSPPRLHEFNGPFSGSSLAAGEHSIGDVVGDDTYKYLRQVYKGVSHKIWADLFAETAPDEDFVETYEAIALQDAGLQSLTIQFTISPSDTADVISNISDGKHTLCKDKVQFIRTLIPTSAIPCK
jgi:hypothetical protein